MPADRHHFLLSSNGTLPGLAAFVFDLAWMLWLVVVAWQRPRR
jgi:hypothetical protein